MACTRPIFVVVGLAAAWWAGCWPLAARGQFLPLAAGELSDTVYVDKVESAARTHLEQVGAYVANQQWDDAIETLRQLQAEHGGKVIHLTADRYVNVRDYCHLQLLQLPADALALYRQRVDATAEAWFREGVTRRDPRLLEQVVEQLFASSWTAPALDALAELRLEQGDYAEARRRWEQLIASPGEPNQPLSRLAVPDSLIALADVRARLVLTSILEGATSRAQRELEAYDELHPGAEGQLAGRKVAYAAVLRSLLEASEAWRAPQADTAPTTFGGHPSRNAVMPRVVEVGSLDWRRPLEDASPGDASVARNLGFRPRRVAEDNELPLSYHPVVYGRTVLISGASGILAFDLEKGEAAWRNPIFTDIDATVSRQRLGARQSVGVPRYTLTVQGDRLYARMGSPLTTQSSEIPSVSASGYIVCLDLAAQGKELWRRPAPEEGWAFEGTPVADAERVFVALRRTDVRPQAHVACYDAESGRPLWTQKVSAAETPARGHFDEVTHNLLTLAGDRVYINTNLGTVAALSTQDGMIQWITQYRRVTAMDLSRPAAQFYRDLNPAVLAEGRLFVAPSDSPSILALDAGSGQILWESNHAEDAVHLLGVGGGHLIASGDRLWFLDVQNGKARHYWPEGPSPRGYGRGVLAGRQVLWPTREEILVFDQATAKLEKRISLTEQWKTQGGNLLVADDYLLVATASRNERHELVAFSQFSRLRKKLQHEVVTHPARPLSHFRLARCEEALGNDQQALDHYRRAFDLSQSERRFESSLLLGLIRERWHRLLMDRASVLRHGDQWREALGHYAAARESAVRPPQRLEALMAAADTAWEHEAVDEARGWYQNLLDDASIRGLTIRRDEHWTLQAGAWARQRLAALDDRHALPVAEASTASTRGDETVAEAAPASLGPSAPVERRPGLTWTASALLPVHDASGHALLHDHDQVRWTSLADGASRWSAASPRPSWALRRGDLLVWGGEHLIQAARVADGQVVWRLGRGQWARERSPAAAEVDLATGARPDDRNDASAIATERVLIVRSGGHSLTGIDLVSGDLLWSLAPPEGALAGPLVAQGERCLATVLDPPAILVVSGADGQIEARYEGAGHPTTPSRVLDAEHLLAAAEDGQLQVWNLQTHQLQWTRGDGPSSAAATDLDFLADAARVVVINSTDREIVSLAPADGHVQWRTALRLPARAPVVLAGLDRGSVYAVWNHRLQALDAVDGRVAWSAPLDDQNAQWRAARWGERVACWPRWSAGPRSFELWLLSAEAGRIEQHLTFRAPIGRTSFVSLPSGGLVQSTDASWALTAVDVRSIDRPSVDRQSAVAP